MTAINKCFPAPHNSTSNASLLHSAWPEEHTLRSCCVRGAKDARELVDGSCRRGRFWSSSADMMAGTYLPSWLQMQMIFYSAHCIEDRCISSLTRKAKGKLSERFTYLYPNALIRGRSALSASPCEGSQVKGVIDFSTKETTRSTLPTYLQPRHQRAFQ